MKKAVGKGHVLVVSIVKTFSDRGIWANCKIPCPSPTFRNISWDIDKILFVWKCLRTKFLYRKPKGETKPKKRKMILDSSNGWKSRVWEMAVRFRGYTFWESKHGWEILPFFMDGLHVSDFHAFPASHVCLTTRETCQRRLCHRVWINFIVMKHTFLLKNVMDRMGIIQNIWNLETGEIFSHIKHNWPWQKTKVTLLKWGSFKELCNSLISDVVMFHFCQPMLPQARVIFGDFSVRN